jgi:DNA polymerase III gamma/tau subunit
MLNLNRNYADLLRPTKLSDIRSQEFAVNLVANMVREGNWSNRLLITGETGTGKTSLAFIIARLFLCNQPDKDNLVPCGVCSNCQLWKDSTPPTHPKLVFIEATTQGGKEDASIITDVMYSAGGKRVLLIDECAELTKAAQTLLQVPLETVMLKNSNLLLIACTAYPQNLKVDFKHRFTPIKFRSIPTDDLVSLGRQVLDELNIEYEDLALTCIASHCENSFRGFLTTLEALVKSLPDTEERVLSEAHCCNYFGVLTSKARANLINLVLSGKFNEKHIDKLRQKNINPSKFAKDLLADVINLNLGNRLKDTKLVYQLIRDVLIVDQRYQFDMLVFALQTLSNAVNESNNKSI